MWTGRDTGAYATAVERFDELRYRDLFARVAFVESVDKNNNLPEQMRKLDAGRCT